MTADFRPFDPLRPTAQAASFAVLTGDPGRALALAQHALKKPTMFNHHRGLWGYVGETQEDIRVLIQSTGFGGPSAAAVLGQLIGYGVETVVRAGTCRPLTGDLHDGEFVVPENIIPADGTSKVLGAESELPCDPQLVEELLTVAPKAHSAAIISTDTATPPDYVTTKAWVASGAAASDLASAAIMQVAERAGVRAACILEVSAHSDSDVDSDPAGFHAGIAALAACSQLRSRSLSSVLRFSRSRNR